MATRCLVTLLLVAASAASERIKIKVPESGPGSRPPFHCPDGKECELECFESHGGNTCQGFDMRASTGWFSKITCVSTQRPACTEVVFPTCPEGKMCEIECKGSRACEKMDYSVRLGVYCETKGAYSKVVCDGQNACFWGCLPKLPVGKESELQCRGWGACKRLMKSHSEGHGDTILQAGSLDILSTNGACLVPTFLPHLSALPNSMKAARFAVDEYKPNPCGGSYPAVLWPPEECKGQEAAGKNWWYCPMSKKCVESLRDCDMSPTQREIGPSQVHNATDILEHRINVQTRGGIGQVHGIVQGHKCTVQTELKVIEDAGQGFVALSSKQIGGLQSIGGSVTDAEDATVIFRLPQEKMWPNFCTRTLSPLLMLDKSVRAAELELCDDGKGWVKIPPVSEGEPKSSRGVILSLANLHYVQQEVNGAIKIQPSGGWTKADGSDPHYHKLGMGDSSMLCVFAGTLFKAWSGGQSSPIMSLPDECTRDYQEEGFVVMALVTVGKERQWMQKGSTTPFHLTLKGSELRLQTTRNDLEGKTVTVSLDGIVLARGGQPSKCNSQQRLGEGKRGHEAWYTIPTSTRDEAWSRPLSLTAKAKELKKLSTGQHQHGSAPAQVSASTSQREHRSARAQVSMSTVLRLRQRSSIVTKPKEAAKPGELETEDQVLKIEAKGSMGRRIMGSVEGSLNQVELKTKLKEALAKTGELETENQGLKIEAKELKTKLKEAVAKTGEQTENQGLKIEAKELKTKPKEAVAKIGDLKEKDKSGDQMEGCTLVGDNSVNTTGFSIISKHNLATMGKDIGSRTCLLRGVVKFTSDGSTATAWLDPNYRDPVTKMPFCFPISGAMHFFASVVNPEETSKINQTVGLQIEPHGRLVILGNQPSDVMVRLDNIMYHPLMKFNDAPGSCAPYCFPTSKLGDKGVAVSGCVKYCTPTQYERKIVRAQYELIPVPCR